MTIIPAYLPPISYFKSVINQNKLSICVNTNYQKQTFRNRCVIYGANGLHKLTIPITHNSRVKRDKDVIIHNEIPWQKNHFRAIQSAYKSSPFFEHYQDELAPFFFKKQKFLFDFNFKILIQIFNFLDTSIEIKETDQIGDISQLNQILNPKKKSTDFKPYNQVFIKKNGFQSDLSIIDVLFNLGPEALDYIKSL